jgi:hypothetical protein
MQERGPVEKVILMAVNELRIVRMIQDLHVGINTDGVLAIQITSPAIGVEDISIFTKYFLQSGDVNKYCKEESWCCLPVVSCH